jgi:hypothetical protein
LSLAAQGSHGANLPVSILRFFGTNSDVIQQGNWFNWSDSSGSVRQKWPKHLIAQDIIRISHVELHPKSRAVSPHNNAPTDEPGQSVKVKVKHFHRASSRRSREIFEKSKGEDQDNSATE